MDVMTRYSTLPFSTQPTAAFLSQPKLPSLLSGQLAADQFNRTKAGPAQSAFGSQENYARYTKNELLSEKEKLGKLINATMNEMVNVKETARKEALQDTIDRSLAKIRNINNILVDRGH